jgi:hypothetical protein
MRSKMAHFACPAAMEFHNQLLSLRKMFIRPSGTAVAIKTLEGAIPMTIY